MKRIKRSYIELECINLSSTVSTPCETVHKHLVCLSRRRKNHESLIYCISLMQHIDRLVFCFTLCCYPWFSIKFVKFILIKF